MKIKVKIIVEYEGLINSNDYLESPTDKPLPDEVMTRLKEDVERGPRYYTDRFKMSVKSVSRIP
jgi:hypothetical protein